MFSRPHVQKDIKEHQNTHKNNPPKTTNITKTENKQQQKTTKKTRQKQQKQRKPTKNVCFPDLKLLLQTPNPKRHGRLDDGTATSAVAVTGRRNTGLKHFGVSSTWGGFEKVPRQSFFIFVVFFEVLFVWRVLLCRCFLMFSCLESIIVVVCF